jgi:hypothetical protein
MMMYKGLQYNCSNAHSIHVPLIDLLDSNDQNYPNEWYNNKISYKVEVLIPLDAHCLHWSYAC